MGPLECLGEISPFIAGGCFVLASVLVVFLNRHHVSHVDDTEKEVKEGNVLKVKDFMIKDVVSIKPDTTIKELLKLLSDHRIGGVPVVDDQDKLIGMVSDGDIIRYLTPKKDPLTTLSTRHSWKRERQNRKC